MPALRTVWTAEPATTITEAALPEKETKMKALLLAGALGLASATAAHAQDLRLKPVNPAIQLSICLDQAAADQKYRMSFAARAENIDDWMTNSNQTYQAAIHECYVIFEPYKPKPAVTAAPAVKPKPVAAPIDPTPLPSFDDVVKQNRGQ
jgi:hypothetical protein